MTEPLPTRRLLVVVAVLYSASGLPFGIVKELVPVWLKVQGTSLEDIGLLNLLALPWTLKALWAPVVDRYGSARRWIVAMLVAIAALTAAAPWSGPGLWLVLLTIAVASATQDVAIDGYTATVTPEHQMGRVNGLRVAAYRGAMLLAGGGAVALGEVLPWPVLFAALGVAALGLAGVATRVPPAVLEPMPMADWLRELWAWVGSWQMLGVLAFVLLFKVGDAAMGPMVKPFWLDAGLSVAEVGLISITLGTALSVAGALVGGELTTRLGLFRGLWLLGGIQAVSNLGYAGAAMVGPEWTREAVYAASILESFAGGLGTAAFLAFLMALCERHQATTRFALLTALAGFTRDVAGAASGFGAQSWGYAPYFGFTFLLALPAFALLPVVRSRLRA